MAVKISAFFCAPEREIDRSFAYDLRATIVHLGFGVFDAPSPLAERWEADFDLERELPRAGDFAFGAVAFFALFVCGD